MRFKYDLKKGVIAYKIHLDAKDLIKLEGEFDVLFESITKKINSKGVLDIHALTSLVDDCEKIHMKIINVKKRHPILLFNFFKELLGELGSYSLEADSHFVTHVRKDLASLKNQLHSLDRKNTYSSKHEKSYESFFKKFASDYKLFKQIEHLEVDNSSYEDILDEVRETEGGFSVGRRLAFLVHHIIDSFEEELEILSIEEVRKLIELNKLEELLKLSSFKIVQSSEFNRLLVRFGTLKRNIRIELADSINFDQMISRIDWELRKKVGEKYQNHSFKIGYHQTKTVMVQFAIIHNFMFGVNGGMIYVSINESFVPAYEQEGVVELLSPKLRSKGITPINDFFYLEFDLRKLDLHISDSNDAIKAIKNMAPDGKIPKVYPWWSFSSPVYLLDYLTPKSKEQVLRLAKSMGF